MKNWICSLIAVAALAVPGARAAFVFTLTEVGNSVQVTGAGTININAFTHLNAPFSVSSQIVPTSAVLASGPALPSDAPVDYYVGGGISGPSNFGTGSTTVYASSGGGNAVALGGSGGVIFVPQGYVSGTPLTTNSTYANASFSSLGLNPGTYTYTWGTGINTDSLTVTALSPAPEPSAWALLGVSAAVWAGAAWRRRAMGNHFLLSPKASA